MLCVCGRNVNEFMIMYRQMLLLFIVSTIMEFTTNQLLKNAPFSAKQYHKFQHYMTLINLAKGIVPVALSVASLRELEKVGFKIDPLTDYITNIFDYDLYIKDGAPDVIYVVDVHKKITCGTVDVDFGAEQLQLTTHRDIASD
jgi:Protein of unknown function (DUF424)